MNTGKYGRYILAGIPLLCSACAIFAPPERMTAELPLADSFAMYERTTPSPDRWWEQFNSEELNGLIEEALVGNFTLQQAYARLVQAAGIAKQAGALRLPDLNYTGDASVSRLHTDTGESTSVADRLQQVNSTIQQANELLSLLQGAAEEPGDGSTPGSGGGAATGGGGAPSEEPYERTFTTRSYRFGLASSYELDLWGRVRARHKAALLDFEASREDVYTAMLTLAFEVTLRWLDILSSKQGIALVQEQLEANRTALELMELRYRNGLATALDIYQQRQIVAQTETVLPLLEARLQTLQHELAILLGKPPRTALGLEDEVLPRVGGTPESGLPADLLAQRPDVRATGLRLRAADWQVSAARADRLPTIRLTASASYGSEEWDLVFDNWMATLAGSLTGPIFDAGRRRAEVDRTRAVADERLAAYRQVVITAVQEVEDALVNEIKQEEFIEALTMQLEAARASYREALARYRKGLNDYLPVLSALINAQSLERSLVQARHDQLIFRVQLHRALGGTWMRESYLQEKG